MSEHIPGLSHLGSAETRYPQDYTPALLEAFPNRHSDLDYMV